MCGIMMHAATVGGGGGAGKGAGGNCVWNKLAASQVSSLIRRLLQLETLLTAHSPIAFTVHRNFHSISDL
jgi:hypothetical protein